MPNMNLMIMIIKFIHWSACQAISLLIFTSPLVTVFSRWCSPCSGFWTVPGLSYRNCWLTEWLNYCLLANCPAYNTLTWTARKHCSSVAIYWPLPSNRQCLVFFFLLSLPSNGSKCHTIQAIRNDSSTSVYSNHILNSGHKHGTITDTMDNVGTHGGGNLNTGEKFYMCKTGEDTCKGMAQTRCT
jgi:hypothetical protein